MALHESSFHRIKIALFLLLHGHAPTLLHEVRNKIGSEEICYGFRRDLNIPVETPSAAIPVDLRFFQKNDIDGLFNLKGMGDGSKAVMDRLRRIVFINAEIPSCYVGLTSDGSPCFMQWLIRPEANARVQSYFKGYFPPLNEDEVMLEGVFIPEKFRGMKIMPFAMSQIAERGKTLGARWAVTYVQDFNLPSIRGVLQAGFRPFLLRRAKWRNFKRYLEFRPLDQNEVEAIEKSWNERFSPNDRRGDRFIQTRLIAPVIEES
jgi:hypothetical protein